MAGQLTLTLSNDLSSDEMEALVPDIIACFQKYVDRFPDETLEHMWSEIVSGRRVLWLVRDETGRVILTPIVEITTVDATGQKILVFAQVGGERIQDALPLIHQIEQWAVEKHNVTEAHFPGRKGYRKLLGDYGFQEKTVIFSKKL